MQSYKVKYYADDWLDCDVLVSAFDADDAAQTSAPIFWDNHEGWEWMKEGGEFDVKNLATGEVTRHFVSVDFEPQFYATEVKS